MWMESFVVFVVFVRVHDTWAWLLPVSIGNFCFCLYCTVRTAFLVVALRAPQVHHKSVTTRTLWWSYFLGTSGLVVRCFRYEFLKGFGRMVAARVPQIVVAPTLWSQVCFYVVLAWYTYRHIQFNLKDNYLYYKIHRTMHACHPLYAFCHALHHRAHFPTLLDSGTISPMELALTELSIPAITLLWPPWISVGYECGYAFVGHVIGHSAGYRHGKHHHEHHQFIACNYGLQPLYDEQFGTLHQPAKQ